MATALSCGHVSNATARNVPRGAISNGRTEILGRAPFQQNHPDRSRSGPISGRGVRPETFLQETT